MRAKKTCTNPAPHKAGQIIYLNAGKRLGAGLKPKARKLLQKYWLNPNLCISCTEGEKRVRLSSGQSLVEFSILLFLIMLLCVGMLFFWRLLSFQFWAQQEARYLAFEQTWAAREANLQQGLNPLLELEDGAYFRRPEMVSGLRNHRSAADAGSLSDLLPPLVHLDIGDNQSEQNVMYASKSKGADKKPYFVSKLLDLNLISSAYATAGGGDIRQSSLSQLQDEQSDTYIDGLPKYPVNNITPSFVELLTKESFGEKLCDDLLLLLKRYKHSPDYLGIDFSSSNCAKSMNLAFAEHLSNNVNFKTLFRSYGESLFLGATPKEGFAQVAREETARQFFSFFDQTIREVRGAAAITMLSYESQNISNLSVDESVRRMITEARYVGSVIAVSTKILEKLGEFSSEVDHENRDYRVEKQIEDSAVSLLHKDVDFSSLVNDFSLSVSALPVPVEYKSLAADLQRGVIENALFFEDGSILQDQVYSSNKLIEVGYEANRGIFRAAKRRGLSGENVWLTGRFYLVTQEWSLPRRSSNGEYYSLEEDEDRLQERVKGLWLFPKKPSEFVRPITNLVGLEELGEVLNLVGELENLLGDVVRFIDDSPLDEIINALEHIPFIGSFISGIPDWPAVRVESYPHSQELTTDRLMSGSDGVRNFQDYLNEQKQFEHRAANPSFN